MEVIQTFYESLMLILRAGAPLFIIIAATVILLILYTIFEPDPEDKQYKEKVSTGVGILLTCDQYLALHEADPERYPVNTSGMWNILRDPNSMLHMNKDEFHRLYSIAYQGEEDKELQEARTRCLDELYHMQDVLGQLVKLREKENEEAVAKASVLTKQISENLEQAGV